MKFKKGVFVGERSIKPMAFKYVGGVSAYSGLLDIFSHGFILFLDPYMVLKIKELPVFKPNEYFWKNHWNKE